jgi:hypothetical protein
VSLGTVTLSSIHQEDEAEQKHIGSSRLRDSDVLRALVFLLRMGLTRTSGRPRSRAFLEFLLQQFPEPQSQIAAPDETSRIAVVNINSGTAVGSLNSEFTATASSARKTIVTTMPMAINLKSDFANSTRPWRRSWASRPCTTCTSPTRARRWPRCTWPGT